MIRATLVLPRWLADELAAVARAPLETGGVLLAGVARDGDEIRLLGRELEWLPDDAYDERHDDALTVSSTGYVSMLARAEAAGALPIWVHTHPGEDGVPRHSRRDHRVDELLREPFAIRAGVDLYVSLVVSPRVDGFAFAGRVLGDDLEGRVERLMISGDRFAFHAAFDAPSEFSLPAEFDRQVRAFGGDVQEVLSTLNVAVVGSGGTGSSVCEQLVRLGVRRLVLVDPDTLSASNVTRVYGSTPADVGRPKVEILRDHLQAIAPDVVIDTIEGKVTEEPLARRLVGSDVIFGCTDDNAGRLVLSRVAAYYLKPLIDCGVLISSTDGFLEGIDGRVTVVTPGRACLVCRGRIDMARAQAEQLDPTERAARAAEGYAPELGAVEPAVVSYTTAVASAAVSELLERLIGYGPDIEPGEILLRMHDREISTNVVEPNPRHYCSLDAGLLGVGDATPFLGMTWPSS